MNPPVLRTSPLISGTFIKLIFCLCIIINNKLNPKNYTQKKEKLNII
ncbi:MAG: hypothetical protein Q8S84_05875 [bacterium]|nr:hypothetical protein [bacterium]MDP3381008.1 hypothetical protein [bacterium]